ncbi:MAG: S8 family serine peptidase [Dysgonamonadaceae bacterium]|jgi:subtilisin family serine protease|nr:S8 family serine peptidase [Dysgonamonadaceae bacterium]
MRNILLSILLLFCSFSAFCEGYMFRIELKDKGNPPYTIENPLSYLSEKSIERRLRQGIAIDSTDFPIDPLYLEEIKATGALIKATSKWVKTVTVYLPDSSAVPALKNLIFVDTLYCVRKGSLSPTLLNPEQNEFVVFESPDYSPSADENIYGEGYTQINMLNGILLHDAGFKGKGMSIAVLDIGFQNSDLIPAFDFDRIKEVKDFTHKSVDPLRITEGHGTTVLSCMLANQQGVMIGTAPEADYYLFKTEVEKEEFPVEEDYWVAAMEYADSIGIDVVNTSLGYSTFDDPSMNHTHEQLDGHTIPASRAAAMAGNKGMLVFNSAGNEGNKLWGKITVPSDAENIITVGAVNAQGVIAAFSSRGPSADGRVKPDLCAMGESATIIGVNGSVSRSSGTSFASPILTGMGACLWQALPHKTSKEIIALMKSVGDRYVNPDFEYGYGIPDVGKAYTENVTDIFEVAKSNTLLFFDTITGCLYAKNADCEKVSLMIFNAQGQLITQDKDVTMPLDLNNLNQGVYIAYIRQGDKQAVQKFLK